MNIKHKTRRWIAGGSLLSLLGVVALTPFNMGGCAAGNMDIAGMVKGGGQVAQAWSLSEKDEPAMGESVVCAVTTQYPLSRDEKLNRYVNLVGLAVASGCPRHDINFCFAVLDTNEVNAFSGPAGYVMITRGAISRMNDESELAGVLAHEIGHVVLRHGYEVTKNAMQLQGASQLASSASRDSRFNGGADALVKTVVSQGWEQPQEFAADQEAVTYLVQSHYDPAGFERFLRKMEAGGGNLMSTHPGKTERVKRVTAKIDQLKARGQGQTLADRFAANVTK